jgi:mannose-6-phosphate isomerase-like protein (cupin superfamily)/uncharacterized protein YndB with AHSA1/START domain
MPKPGDVIDVPDLNLRFELRATAESTGGEYCEFDAVGNPRGFIRAMHVHVGVTERHEVLEGSLHIKLHGKVHTLRPGDSIVIPPGAPHYQRGATKDGGRVRIRHTPAGDVERFLVRLGEMSAAGDFNRFGLPKPVAGARFVAELGHSGHAARPSLKVQRGLARAILKLADTEYEFVDEWHVDAAPEAVFDVLADGTTYPAWWRPVYIGVEADDGPPEVGKEVLHHFKGRLPYTLKVRTTTTALERPHRIEVETDGDLRGTGIWTLAAAPGGGTNVTFDWRVHADRTLLEVLTPLLRPALRWNHSWAIARAMEGLEPYVRANAKVAA